MTEASKTTTQDSTKTKPQTDKLTTPKAPEIADSNKASISDKKPQTQVPEPTPDAKTPAQKKSIAEKQTPDKESNQHSNPPKNNPEKEPETNKPKKAERSPRLPKEPKGEKQPKVVDISIKSTSKNKPKPTDKTEQPQQATPAPPPEPKEAPRTGEQEQIVYLNLSELHPFKDHPFQVRQDEEMKAMVESVKDKGVTNPAIVRPREKGGYEIVSGHRRQLASEMANYTNMPCIIRNLTDEQAITQMVEDNTNQRENILPSERAKALKMQLDAIKRQGARDENGIKGQRSNEIVAERNKTTVKQVQRYIKLNELVPDLLRKVDEKKIPFTTAVELAFISQKNQNYIAVAIEGQQAAPSLSQTQRMRDLDQKGILNGDMIDGIMMEEKKEADKVIISSQELSKYFGPDKTPREMKDTILKLLDEHKAKNPPELSKPEKQNVPEK